MEHSSDTTTTTTTTTTTATTTGTTTFPYRHASSPTSSSSPASSPPPPPPLSTSPPVVLSPCAACKILRRRCVDKCVLAPYFPPTEPLKFTTAHRVFGASNIIKLLQDLPESQRADAVSSMVYEANARIRDPVYGCAGAICQLQKQVNELKVQLARSQAELVATRTQHANLLAILCVEAVQQQHQQPQPPSSPALLPAAAVTPYGFQNDGLLFVDDCSSVWEEPLWT
ncbi:LOB domain-containing protein 1 [Ananas comosus]|uniref:LOB domain-containing protein 1 n=1 Tax=Ananas comosus TaxID=4615 RepID=A0A199UTJ3_ANACO|nr:LOB domain-containing protein 1 [Ananas comosus]